MSEASSLNSSENKRNKLTLSMIVKNESNRYLEQVLRSHREYIDEAVIIDDGSTDDTAEICRELLKGIPLHLVQNPLSKFSNEIVLRKQQWEETIKTNPDWILNMDADEMFEKKFKDKCRELINRDGIFAYSFRLYDFWDENHYREDIFWCAHVVFRPFLIKYVRDFEYKWRETPQHCGRFPENIFALPNGTSWLRVKHFGWMKPEDRAAKYKRYMELDPGALYGSIEQYETILDEKPRLIEWEE